MNHVPLSSPPPLSLPRAPVLRTWLKFSTSVSDLVIPFGFVEEALVCVFVFVSFKCDPGESVPSLWTRTGEEEKRRRWALHASAAPIRSEFVHFRSIGKRDEEKLALASTKPGGRPDRVPVPNTNYVRRRRRSRKRRRRRWWLRKRRAKRPGGITSGPSKSRPLADKEGGGPTPCTRPPRRKSSCCNAASEPPRKSKKNFSFFLSLSLSLFLSSRRLPRRPASRRRELRPKFVGRCLTGLIFYVLEKCGK